MQKEVVQPPPQTSISSDLTSSSHQNQPHTNPSRVEESMWSAFQNILTFISLAFFAGSLHLLWSIFINQWFPVTGNEYIKTISSHFLNSGISTLIVSTPFFVLLFLITNKRYIQQPELKKTRSKKALNYIALIVTFIIIMVRTISAINTALNDAFTTNFGYNLLITFTINGLIFAYYLYEVRIEKRTASMFKYIAATVVISMVAIGTVIVSFSVRSDIAQERNLSRRPTTNMPIPVPTQGNKFLPVDESEIVVLATASNLPSSAQTIQGIDFYIEKARAYEANGEILLEMDFVFAANTPCPLTGGSVCGVNAQGIKGTDNEGFVLENSPIIHPEKIKFTNLLQGEKTRGKHFFKLQEVSERYFITYRASSGLPSDKVEVLMSLR